jgi:hypothetical protein
VAEVLAEENEALRDIPWIAGNLITGDVHYKRTSMPNAHMRKINQGVESSVSKKEAETDTCAQIVGRSVVDLAELKLSPDPAAFLALEARPHIAKIGEDVVRTMFWGKNSAEVLGIAPRYNKIAGAPKEKTSQIVDYGGTGSKLQSVYIVKWDGREVTGIYPKNTTAGLEIAIMPEALVPDVEGKTFRAHLTDYSQWIGLKIRDSRFVARLCNIDMDDLASDDAARAKLFNDLITTKNKIFHVSQGRVVMYMSPDLANLMEITAFNKANTVVGFKEGMTSDTRILSFAGILIRRNDFQAEPEVKVV